jgi:hypothetical protein
MELSSIQAQGQRRSINWPLLIQNSSMNMNDKEKGKKVIE